MNIVPLWSQLRQHGLTSAVDVLRATRCLPDFGSHVRLDAILKLLGIPVLELKPDSPYDGESYASASPSPQDARIAVRSSGQTLERRRFTVAHELGHVLLHPLGTHFRDSSKAPRKTEVEREADNFAGKLLMPGQAVSSYVELLAKQGAAAIAAAIASDMKVSIDAANVRMNSYLRGDW
jgi:Zn-dependent peptidase ImmA (M78 family)